MKLPIRRAESSRPTGKIRRAGSAYTKIAASTSGLLAMTSVVRTSSVIARLAEQAVAILPAACRGLLLTAPAIRYKIMHRFVWAIEIAVFIPFPVVFPISSLTQSPVLGILEQEVYYIMQKEEPLCEKCTKNWDFPPRSMNTARK